MPEPEFKILAGPRDWGSPLAAQPSFKTLEEAQEAAREYQGEQIKAGGPALPERIVIEETRPDGSTVAHSVG